jgi:hypothetical protein
VLFPAIPGFVLQNRKHSPSIARYQQHTTWESGAWIAAMDAINTLVKSVSLIA